MKKPVSGGRGVRKERRGTVLRKSGNKTAVVVVERKRQHPLYGKYVRRSGKLHVHDEENKTEAGDTVRIVETRPRSRLKRWRIAEVLGKSAQ
ncbi:MAG: 30S ribosomal protein S17 [Kiritimatiellia bacterium]